MRSVDILDCTIRDGSYVVGNKWTKEHVSNITYNLAAAGFKFIEVGNGIGLGAYRNGVNSICSDEEYIRYAAENKGAARIGVFFIPGIGNETDLNMLVDNGGDFVRIGADVSDSGKSLKILEYAKSLGLYVGFNFMKSYVISPFELCSLAQDIESAGADCISLVDSAGGMLPSEVGQYMHSLKSTLNTKLGFHGHNNLLLANANNIAAIENGADVVDTTLMGIGRGAGNAQTETMLVILEKMGFHTGISPLVTSRISQEYILPMTDKLKGSDYLQLVLGYAQFHDSYLAQIDEYAKKYNIAYDTLIIEVSKIEKEKPTAALIEKVAANIKEGLATPRIFFPKFIRNE